MLAELLGTVLGAVAPDLFKMGAQKLGFGQSGQNVASSLGAGVSQVPMMLDAGRSQGIMTKNFLDRAYPGTTAAERIGSNAGGSIGAGDLAGRRQEQMQQRELSNRKSIADQQARSQVISAYAPYGAKAAKEAVGTLGGGDMQEYVTAIGQAERKLPLELRNLKASEKATLAQAYVSHQRGRQEEARGDIAKILARADATRDLPFWMKMTRLADAGNVQGLIDLVKKNPDIANIVDWFVKLNPEAPGEFTTAWTSFLTRFHGQGSRHQKRK